MDSSIHVRMSRSFSAAKSFIRYWAKNLTSAKEAKEKIVGWLTFGLPIIGAVSIYCKWSAASKTEIAEIIEDIALAWAGIFFLLVKPYQRHCELMESLDSIQRQLAPQLEFACAMDIDGCTSRSHGANLLYFRLRVMNCSKVQAITACSAHLLRVERNGSHLPIQGKRNLPFAPSHAPDAGEKVLMPNVPEFVDVIAVHFGSIGQLVVLPEVGGGANPIRLPDRGLLFSDPGDYFLIVAASGVGIVTQEIKLKFHWSGDASTSALGTT